MNLSESCRRLFIHSLGMLCALIFACLVIDVLFGVFTREILNAQPAWTEELARLLLVWLSLLGGVLAYADDRHLGVDIVVSHLHPDSRRIARIISHLCVFGFALAVLVIGGLDLFLNRWESGQMMATIEIRKAWFYMILPLSGGMILLLAMGKTFTALRLPNTKEEAS